MNAIEIIRVYGAAGRGSELESALSDGLHNFTDDPECKSIKLYRGVEDPDGFYLYVEWSSIEAHKEWRKTDRRTDFLDSIAEFKERSNQFGHYDLIASR